MQEELASKIILSDISSCPSYSTQASTSVKMKHVAPATKRANVSLSCDRETLHVRVITLSTRTQSSCLRRQTPGVALGKSRS